MSNISVTLKLNSILKRYDPLNNGVMELTLEEGSTIGQALERVGIIRGETEFMILNRRIVKEETILKDGDIVELYPIVGGG